tara:strand:- start:1199 stop:2572 length:1374 start_codon:yes stop_codon:yes gene_type:complete
MATHDYNLANQSGASFRSDLNNALAAILSNNSNASEPSTTVAYSIWADTNAGKLKIRNAANDGFVDLINLDGTIQRDVSLTGDLTLTDKIIHSGDTNTAIRFPADDTFTIETAGSERLRVDSSGFVVLGLTAGRAKLDLGNGSNFATSITRTADRYQLLLDASDTSNCFSNNIGFILNGGTTVVAAINSIEEGGNGSTGLSFATSSNSSSDPVEVLRLTSTGRVGIGDDDPDAQLHLKSSSPRMLFEDTSTNAKFRINADSGAGNAGFDVDLNSVTSTPALTFTIKGSELMRLKSDGDLFIGATSFSSGTKVKQFEVNSNAIATKSSASATSLQFHNEFHNANGLVGSISTNGSATSFSTSSDYRLKENAIAISDGITRLKTLKPYRFNFIVDPTKTVDGFFAHEVTAVPEAITGTKDEVDSDNNPIYQAIDQSKLVPLIVAAVQELIGKVAALEAA